LKRHKRICRRLVTDFVATISIDMSTSFHGLRPRLLPMWKLA